MRETGDIMEGTMIDARIKHLEFIQAVIARLARNSYFIRGWTLTLVSVLFVVGAGQDFNPLFYLLALIPIGAFATLDGYYLWQERLFRDLYNAASMDLGCKEVPLFSMSIAKYKNDNNTWARAVRGTTVRTFHGVLAVITIAFTAASGVIWIASLGD